MTLCYCVYKKSITEWLCWASMLLGVYANSTQMQTCRISIRLNWSETCFDRSARPATGYIETLHDNQDPQEGSRMLYKLSLGTEYLRQQECNNCREPLNWRRRHIKTTDTGKIFILYVCTFQSHVHLYHHTLQCVQRWAIGFVTAYKVEILFD